MLVLEKEQRLCRSLRDLPKRFNYRYTPEARRTLLQLFFRALVNDKLDYLDVLFNSRVPKEDEDWLLRDAQGAVDGAEYTEAARGKPCGHIFKAGEATYRCQTCTVDDTCVLCSRCYESSDHTGHRIQISISPGNSGCCDCGDAEAWRLPVNCAIHSANASDSSNKGKEALKIPSDLDESIRMTVGRAFDYMCDVISCSPEQLRLSKSEASIREDERASRLQSHFYEGGDEEQEMPEFVLVLWNDEKHAIYEVQNQVARACNARADFGMEKARETDDIGRSVITYSRDLRELLDKARIIENIKITVTIRSARDTFREQMCSTIIEWLLDISGCSVGPDHDVLKQTVCKEMLKAWRTGSRASNAYIGKDGIDDHEIDEAEQEREMITGGRVIQDITTRADGNVAVTILQAAQRLPIDDDSETVDGTQDGETDDLMEMDLDMGSSDPDLDMRPNGEPEDDLEAQEATFAGYPPPPPPPPHQPPGVRIPQTPSVRAGPAGRGGESTQSTPRAVLHVPKTPWAHARSNNARPPPSYWLEKPHEVPGEVPLAEDVSKRVRLDWMILFDLRLWKKARVDLRSLYISTVVTVPDFKRILGLRFAGLYTVLAQLYLIADREPDHSIIYLSLQMLTTASITREIIEKGNFLTNLIAILFTFLTARQVGHPFDVSTNAQLAFDAGSVTNRRMYHFFMDMKHLFQSEFVQERLRQDDRYVYQFLDLIKLPQGICPNSRAVGDHIEYETDAWISASILTRELNRLCRQFAEAFRWRIGEDPSSVSRNIRTFARATIINSIGAERRRFEASEISHEVRFKSVNGPRTDMRFVDENLPAKYSIVDFVVEKEPISFHHALHYTLSWLVDGAKSMPAHQLRSLLEFELRELQEAAPYPQYKSTIPDLESETYLISMFDYPIRVCAWLAQMKAGMWVRNGLSLRHQMSTYRGVAPRDLAYQRDIFLIQTAMITCDPTRVLLSLIDRFGMSDWMNGDYKIREGFEETQLLDVAEDFLHLMIIILSERTALQPVEDEPFPQALAIRRDIAHILCFKPLSFSELTGRLAEKFQELDEFQDILEEMTNFKAPEGLSDTGTFELKPEYLAELDPYIAHYSKNQRDEAETVYRKWVSKKTGKPVSEVVLEPKPRVIKSGLFKDLTAFTNTAVFTQVAYYSLKWALTAHQHSSKLPVTRVEAFLLVVLHLLLIAVLEDRQEEESMHGAHDSFIHRMLFKSPNERESIFMSLQGLLTRDEFKSCHAKAHLILIRAQQRQPQSYAKITATLGLAMERLGTDSPAAVSAEDIEAKKKQALDRQAKVMAQFQKQQQDFLNSQSTIDWGEDDFPDSDSVTMGQEEHKQVWKYPSGNCILCQEETNDARLYGTFALLAESNILRQTEMQDGDWVREVVDLPKSLDRSAEAIRPYGVGGQNRVQVRKLTSDGMEVLSERQGLGKGFRSENCRQGTVSIGCGHIMHYTCFDLYCSATTRRQTHQIARNHPERLDHKEFVCPLCKALGNAFMPIIWKGKEEGFPSVLQTETAFSEWIDSKVGLNASRFNKQVTEGRHPSTRQHEIFASNVMGTLIAPSAVSLITRMSTDPGPTSPLRSSIANMPGIFPEENDLSHPTVSETFALEELMGIYGRIRDTIRFNKLHSQFPYELQQHGEDLSNTDVLATALGYSISATEIAQRGVESEPGSILLDKISPLTLTHLRILAETASSYISIGGLRGNGNNRPSEEFYLTQSRQQLLFFGGHPQMYGTHPWKTSQYTPEVSTRFPAALAHDPFVLLTETSIFLVPALQIDILHMVQLCYLMEVVKVILTVQCHYTPETWNQIPIPQGKLPASDEVLGSFRKFLAFLEINNDLHIHFSTMESLTLTKLYTIVSSYSLAFLRKSAILLHVSFGVDFPNSGYADMDEPELDRLTKALRLPTLPRLFSSVTGSSNQTEPSILQQVLTGWISHWRHGLSEGGPFAESALLGLRPSHPGIFELIGLPKHYDTLLDEVMRRRCPTTKKDLVEPAICLFCGDIFCSQAVCCSVDGLGGCNLHMQK
ncbi:MAG: hypothetical protein MMC23_007073 [Stictis urceolatum]|nr:hypothetical protein [Stictis urceolata]